jgi:hypothetical protein
MTGVKMKPIYVAMLLVFMTIVFSTLLVAEFSNGFVSRNGMQIITSIGPQSPAGSSGIETALMGAQIPELSFERLSIASSGNELSLDTVIVETSGGNQNIILKISSYPADLFADMAENRIITPGRNLVSIKIPGINARGNYRITVSANTPNGYLINSTDTYGYIGIE